jgi:hypothetical protein
MRNGAVIILSNIPEGMTAREIEAAISVMLQEAQQRGEPVVPPYTAFYN